jgi:hypothetical protein
MRVLLVALLVGSLLQIAQVPVTAAPAEQSSTPPGSTGQNSAAQMTVRAGFEGYGKANGWLPIEVEVRNDGPDIDGEIQIVVSDASGNRSTYMRAPVVYSAPAVLPKRSHKRILMEAEMRLAGQRIQARLLERGTVLAEQDVPLTRVPTGDLLCGVLSRSGPAFDFLPTLELPPPLRRTRLAHIEIENLPTRPQVLASLDCLIVSNISTAGMVDSQRAALSSWVHSGGLLITIGGASWQRTLTGLPQELLPVQTNGLISLENLESLADIGGEPIKDPGPWLISQASVTDGNVVVEQSGVPLVAAARRGNGTVMYLAMDPSAEPLRSWSGASRLWRYVLAHGSTNVGVGSASSSPFSGWGRYPRGAMVDVSLLNGPSPVVIMLALGLFALIVGPVNYLFLARFGRPGWSVVTIPLITGLATVGTFTLASAYRDSDVIVNKVSVVRGYPTAPAYARTYVSVLSRRQANLAVSSNEHSLLNSLYYPFPRDPAPDAAPWSVKIVEGITPVIDEFQLQAGALGTLLVDSQVTLPGQLETDLRVEGRQVLGSITNRLDTNIYDASLIVDFQVLKLGDLRRGETREVAMTLVGNGSAGVGPPSSFAAQLAPQGSGRRGNLSGPETARKDVLEATFGTGFSAARFELAGPTLLGWIDTSAAAIQIADVRPSTVETTMLVSSLPITLPKGFEGELPPQVIQRRQLGTMSLNRQQSGSYDLTSGESLAFQFSLPSGTSKLLLDGLYVNIDGRLRGAAGASNLLGEVSLFNWRTAEWEDRVVGFGRNLVRDVAPYVSAAGDIRVRYTFKPPPDTAATGVSFSRFDVTASGLMR